MQWLLMRDGVLVEIFNITLGQSATEYCADKYNTKDKDGNPVLWNTIYTLYAYSCGKVPS